MADNEVGKVSLGLELEKDGVTRSFGAIARSMGATFSKTMRSTMHSIIKAIRATKPVPAPSIDVEKTHAEIDHLTQVLDNINARLDLQRNKLADLQEAYRHTFSVPRKAKIQEEILKTEAYILRLTKQSDRTAQQIWKLEDALNNAGQGAENNRKSVNKSERSLKRKNRTLLETNKSFRAAAKGAGIASAAFLAAGRRATEMGNQFTQAFRRIAKQVLIFSVLYKAIRSFQNYLGSSLRTNDEYVRSLNAIKTNLAVAFQPIYDAILPAINAFMSALARITAYIATFISSLFGKTYKQSYEAAKGLNAARKAMDGYGKSAKRAAGQLAAFDELHTLQQDGGVDAGGGPGADESWQMEMPELDIDRIQTQMDALVLSIRTTFERTFQAIRNGWNWTVDTFGPGLTRAWGIIQPELYKWKEQFGSMFADVVSLGEPLKNWFQNDLIPFWDKSVTNAATIFAGLSESVRNAFASIWNAAFPIMQKFINDGLPRITEFASRAQDVFMNLFSITKQIFGDIWQDAVDPALQIMSRIIRDTLDIIFEWWDEWGTQLVDGISETLDQIRALWDNLWQKLLKPIITSMLDTISKLWNEHLKGLIKEITNFVGVTVKAAQDIFNKFIMPIVNWLVRTFSPVFAEIFKGAISVIGTALGAIIDAAKGIIRALSGIIEFLAGAFTLDWKRAWNGIKTFMSGIGDAIVGVFKGAVNAIIEAFNWMIRQLNKVSIDIPDWVPGMGGKTFGISIPTIPKLAKGGLVTAPTLAMVGDNPHANVDPEVVAPLSKLQEMLGGSNQEVVEVLYMILAALQDYSRRPVLLEANGTQLAKVIDDARDDRYRRAGRTLGLT